MLDRAYIISRTLEDKIAITENIGQNTMIVTLDVLKEILTMLKEQEPKHGKWIILTDCANEGIYCSNCNTKIFEQTTMPKKKLSHFCPNCGSKNELFYNPTTKEYKVNEENENYAD